MMVELGTESDSNNFFVFFKLSLKWKIQKQFIWPGNNRCFLSSLFFSFTNRPTLQVIQVSSENSLTWSRTLIWPKIGFVAILFFIVMVAYQRQIGFCYFSREYAINSWWFNNYGYTALFLSIIDLTSNIIINVLIL